MKRHLRLVLTWCYWAIEMREIVPFQVAYVCPDFWNKSERVQRWARRLGWWWPTQEELKACLRAAKN